MLAKFNPINVWRNIRELDLQRIRGEAEKQVRIVIAGANPERMQTLANQLRRDPRRPDDITHTLIPLVETSTDPSTSLRAGFTPSGAEGLRAGPSEAVGPSGTDLILLVFTGLPEQRAAQAAALRTWAAAGIPVISVIDPGETPIEAAAAPVAAGFSPVFAAADDWAALQTELAPAILKILPDDILALGRHFPMLRETVARKLISDTSSANAAYSFSTGLAEIIPGINVPLNVADMIVLTKAQALLVYKLGLALGLSPDWQYYITEFSGVIGSSFLWRQVARSLIGLIPAWGIVPKVAVAYSGTYAVGQAVLHWYLTGKHATRKMLGGFAREALARGQAIGRSLQRRLPRRRREALPAGEAAPMLPSPDARICTHCGTVNDEDARFCKSCGNAL